MVAEEAVRYDQRRSATRNVLGAAKQQQAGVMLIERTRLWLVVLHDCISQITAMLRPVFVEIVVGAHQHIQWARVWLPRERVGESGSEACGFDTALLGRRLGKQPAISRSWRVRLVDACASQHEQKLLQCVRGAGCFCVKIAYRSPLGHAKAVVVSQYSPC